MIERLLQAERAMALGLVDQAEAIYRQLVETDPRNAVAVVGLARVALERRQDRLAYDLSVRALEIDPQDAAALRMEARLSEVLVARGETVQRPAFVLPEGGARASAGPNLSDVGVAVGDAGVGTDGLAPAAGSADSAERADSAARQTVPEREAQPSRGPGLLGRLRRRR